MNRAHDVALKIMRRAERYRSLDDAKAFMMLVVNPPVENGLRRTDPSSTAFWGGYDGDPPTAAFNVPFRAGRFRRELEDDRNIQQVVAAAIDQQTGLPIQPPRKPLPPLRTPNTSSPHSDDAGFVLERRLPDGSTLALYDRNKGGDWIDADARWIVCRYDHDDVNTGIVSFETRKDATETMRAEASGEATGIDWGVEDGRPRP